MIVPIIRIDRMIIVIALITLNFGRVETGGFCRETLRFFLIRLMVIIGVRKTQTALTA